MLKTEEIKRFINNDRTGRRKRNLRLGQKYYEGKHDILAYRLFYFNADSKLVEDTTRSNIKISHPFFTELVDQCVQYMLWARKVEKNPALDLNSASETLAGAKADGELNE